MKQSSCLGTTYQTRQKLRLGSSKHQSRAPSQDLINRLPKVCITEIFRRVENPEDRQSCASVCWRWAKILVSLQSDFWHPFSVHQAVHPCLHLSDIVDAKLAADVVDINTKEAVTDLELRCSPCSTVAVGISQLTDTGIHFVTSVCRNLKSVHLINCKSLTNKAAFTIAANCSALQNLMFCQCPITDDGLSQVAKQCSKLSSLHIEGSPYMTEASLRALVQDAKRLESLTLGSCPKIGEDAIMTFLMDHPYLGKFELKGMMAAEPRLNAARQLSLLGRHVCSLRQLHSLILVNCPGLQDESMLKFSDIHLRMLRHLVIDDCRGVTHLGLMWLAGNASNPLRLKTIKLGKLYFSKNTELMEMLSRSSESIESIILDSCDFGLVMPLHSIDHVAQECPRLKVIKLVYCMSIMDSFLSWVSMACYNLKELSLIGFSLTAQDHGIDMLAYFFRILHRNRITKVELGRCCQVTDKDVFMIGRACQGDLQELTLDECPHISGAFAPNLRLHCPNLIKLHLSGTLLEDDDIKIIVDAGFENLEELNLMVCPFITDSALHTLAAISLPKLRRVNVAGCRCITQKTVDYYQCSVSFKIEF
jgi:EIN3-binding F-box protein